MAGKPKRARSTTGASARGIRVNVVRMAHAKGLDLPAYQSEQAAGMDLVAAIEAGTVLRLNRGGRALVPTGLQLELPAGYEAQIRPRSGLAYRHGITVLNSPGTVDADYRGEVQVLLVNLGEKTFVIERGERIAQLVIAPVMQGALVETQAVATTERGAGGFGSTGKGAVGGEAGKAKPAKLSRKPR